MKSDKMYWKKIAKKIIKTELTKRDISYPELTKKLNDVDVHLDVRDLRARIARGSFSAALFIQCLHVIGVKSLVLDENYFLEN